MKLLNDDEKRALDVFAASAFQVYLEICLSATPMERKTRGIPDVDALAEASFASATYMLAERRKLHAEAVKEG